MSAAAAPYVDYGAQFAPFYDQIFPREQIGPEQISWLVDVLPAGARRVAELGVGTGRVALPLAEALRDRAGGPVEYLGVDISAEMLAALSAHDRDGLVTPLLADATRTALPDGLDAVLCVCATISMVTDPAGQAGLVAAAAAALRPGGVLVVETHHVEAVRALHPVPERSWAVAVPGDRRMLATFSHLEGASWNLEHCWIEAGTATFARESSRVTALDEIDAYARAAGLEGTGRTAGLGGAPLGSSSPTATAVYRRPPTPIPTSTPES